MQVTLWGWAGIAVGIMALGVVADRRDRNRRDPDRVAMLPWPLIQVLALLAAVMLAGAALTIG